MGAVLRWMSELLAVLAILGAAFHVRAQEPVDFEQLQHDGWRVRDGAPSQTWVMAQTADGLLWLGGAFGLVRFDGVQFDEFESVTGEVLPRLGVFTMVASRDGGLWVAHSRRGLSRIKDGRVTSISDAGLDQAAIYWLRDGLDGSFWGANSDALFRFDGQRWSRVDGAVPGGITDLTDMAVDARGWVWLCEGGRLLYLPRHELQFKVSGESCRGYNALVVIQGNVWIFESERLRPAPDVDAQEPAAPSAPLPQSRLLMSDRAGFIWTVDCRSGVCRRDIGGLPADRSPRTTGTPQVRDSRQGLTADHATALMEDREGNVWVATKSGLDRFRKGAIIPVAVATSGLHYGLTTDGAGGVLATVSSLGDPVLYSVSPKPRILPRPESMGVITALLSDRQGRQWIGSETNIWKREGGVISKLPSVGARRDRVIRQILQRGDEIWANVEGLGVFRLVGDAWRPVSLPGLPMPVLTAWIAVGPGSDLWVAGQDNRAWHVVDGQTRELGRTDGIDIGDAQYIYAGRSQVVLVGERGVLAWNGTSFRRLASDRKELFWGVTGVVETARGELWLNGKMGLVLVTQADLAQFMANNEAELHYRLFDSYDGYPGQATFYPKPSAIETSKGRIWLSGSDGIGWVDPAQLKTNPIAPTTAVKGVAVDGTVFRPADGVIALPRGSKNLTVLFTAASLSVPERVRFRFMLSGVDSRWRLVERQRETFYANLPPGSYQFRVAAANNDGVWGEEASQQIVIEANFYQTTWFLATCVVAALLLAWGVYQSRIRQVTRLAHEKMTERVAERERIARDLHDTLLQGVEAFILRFHVSLSRVPDSHPSYQSMQENLRLADDVLAESRQRILALKSSGQPSTSLTEEIEATAGQLARDYDCAWSLEVEGRARPLRRSVQDEIELIVGEALLNAFRHSRSARVEIKVQFRMLSLAVSVSDQGEGIPARILREGREGHLGLATMRERARELGGALSISSVPGRGTTVSLVIRSFLSYAKPARGRERAGEEAGHVDDEDPRLR